MRIARILRRLVLMALMLAAALALVALIGVPWAEHQASSRLGSALGADVAVHAVSPYHLALLGGTLGDLNVTASRLVRGDIVVRDVRARVLDAHLDRGDIFGGRVVVRFKGVHMQGAMTQSDMQRWAADAAHAAGIPLTGLRVRIVPGAMLVDARGEEARVHLRAAGPRAVALDVAGTSSLAARLRELTANPLQLPPLPYGARLRAVVLRRGEAILVAAAPAGSQRVE